MGETTDARLARIETGIHHLNLKMDERHQEILAMMKPAVKNIEKHGVQIALLKRDRRWIYGILATLGSGLGIAVKLILHTP